MYTIKTSQVGPFESLILSHTHTGEEAELVPAVGGVLQRLWLRDAQGELWAVIKAETRPDHLLTDVFYHGAVLAPFPNRVAGGAYAHGGQQFQLPPNEAARHCAIHGFVSHRGWQVVARHADEHCAEVRLSYRNDADFIDAYPYLFACTAVYRLGAGGLSLRLGLQNLGLHPQYSGPLTEAAMPCGIGWHPYFCLAKPNEQPAPQSANAYWLRLPSDATYVYDENLTPLHSTRAHGKFLQLHRLGDTFFDNCFDLDVPAGEAWSATELRAGKQGPTLRVLQKSGPGLLNYTQVFTPPARDCFAIEPMSCAPNALRNGRGLRLLPPMHTLEGEIQVELR